MSKFLDLIVVLMGKKSNLDSPLLLFEDCWSVILDEMGVLLCRSRKVRVNFTAFFPLRLLVEICCLLATAAFASIIINQKLSKFCSERGMLKLAVIRGSEYPTVLTNTFIRSEAPVGSMFSTSTSTL